MNNNINTIGAAAIVNNLMNNSSLVILNLHKNGIGPNAITMMLNLIIKNNGLKEMGVDNNNFDDQKDNIKLIERILKATAND